MAKTVYVQELRALLEFVREAEDGRLALESLQHRLYEAEHAITLHEERSLRTSLGRAENRLEKIRFTTRDEDMLSEARLVLAELKLLLEDLLTA